VAFESYLNHRYEGPLSNDVPINKESSH